MGRQIEFIHIEDDIAPFLAAIEKCGGDLVCDGDVKPPLAFLEIIISQMATSVGQCSIVPSNMFSGSFSVLSGNVVEFTNCKKGNSLSRVYEAGRLFISPTPDGVYDPHLLKLFEAMREYIKRNYCYSKSSKIYYSPSFKEQYDRCYYYAAKIGRRISL